MMTDIWNGKPLPETNICVVGLGYVGLPLAVAFAKRFTTLGFDTNLKRIEELKSGVDRTAEVSSRELRSAKKLKFVHSLNRSDAFDTIVITVPTPVDEEKHPDLSPLISATKSISDHIKPGSLIIYESTVYPGATEEVCVPIIEEQTGLKLNVDFYCGYSPERINPGDKAHRLTDILKLTSGSNAIAAEKVDQLYNSIIDAGTYRVPSIKVAEAAKVIENTQRDVNIALINELSIIFNKIGIDTEEVLKAAETKWNFLSFRPGLVGGHCIGVDPYYLLHKARSLSLHPEIITSGRRVNDYMSTFVAQTLVKEMLSKNISMDRARILIMGFAFKENCPDIRNTQVINVINGLKEYGLKIDVYDPLVNTHETYCEHSIMPVEELIDDRYDALVLAVAHKEFLQLGTAKILSLCKKERVIYDLKYQLPADVVDLRL